VALAELRQQIGALRRKDVRDQRAAIAQLADLVERGRSELEDDVGGPRGSRDIDDRRAGGLVHVVEVARV